MGLVATPMTSIAWDPESSPKPKGGVKNAPKTASKRARKYVVRNLSPYMTLAEYQQVLSKYSSIVIWSRFEQGSVSLESNSVTPSVGYFAVSHSNPAEHSRLENAASDVAGETIDRLIADFTGLVFKGSHTVLRSSVESSWDAATWEMSEEEALLLKSAQELNHPQDARGVDQVVPERELDSMTYVYTTPQFRAFLSTLESKVGAPSKAESAGTASIHKDQLERKTATTQQNNASTTLIDSLLRLNPSDRERLESESAITTIQQPKLGHAIIVNPTLKANAKTAPPNMPTQKPQDMQSSKERAKQPAQPATQAQGSKQQEQVPKPQQTHESTPQGQQQQTQLPKQQPQQPKKQKPQPQQPTEQKGDDSKKLPSHIPGSSVPSTPKPETAAKSKNAKKNEKKQAKKKAEKAATVQTKPELSARDSTTPVAEEKDNGRNLTQPAQGGGKAKAKSKAGQKLEPKKAAAVVLTIAEASSLAAIDVHAATRAMIAAAGAVPKVVSVVPAPVLVPTRVTPIVPASSVAPTNSTAPQPEVSSKDPSLDDAKKEKKKKKKKQSSTEKQAAAHDPKEATSAVASSDETKVPTPAQQTPSDVASTKLTQAERRKLKKQNQKLPQQRDMQQPLSLSSTIQVAQQLNPLSDSTLSDTTDNKKKAKNAKKASQVPGAKPDEEHKAAPASQQEVKDAAGGAKGKKKNKGRTQKSGQTGNPGVLSGSNSAAPTKASAPTAATGAAAGDPGNKTKSKPKSKPKPSEGTDTPHPQATAVHRT